MDSPGHFRITDKGTWTPEWEAQYGYDSIFVFPDFGTIEIAFPTSAALTRVVEMRDTRWPLRWAALHTVWHSHDLAVGAFLHNMATWNSRRWLANFFYMMTAELTRALPSMQANFRTNTSGMAFVFAELCHHDRTALSCVNREFNRAFRSDTEISPRIRRVRAFVKRVRRVKKAHFKIDTNNEDIGEFFSVALGAQIFDVPELAEWFAMHGGRTTAYAFVARKGGSQPVKQPRRASSQRASKRWKPS
jgi:hypothetical protein